MFVLGDRFLVPTLEHGNEGEKVTDPPNGGWQAGCLDGKMNLRSCGDVQWMDYDNLRTKERIRIQNWIKEEDHAMRAMQDNH